VSAPTSPTVRDNPARSRYEIHEGEQLVGFTTYRLGDGQISFLHTEVAPEFGGRGLAKQLVTEELADARRRGLAVLPYCPYVAKVIAQNLDAYLDLVPEAERHGFRLPRSAEGTGRSGARPVKQ
jgi:uncharacterized protein